MSDYSFTSKITAVFGLSEFCGLLFNTFEPPYVKTSKMACAPSEDLDQPRHLPSLIRVFAVRMKKPWVLSYPLSAQQRLWSDWANAQADLSLHWAHSYFVGFCHEVAHSCPVCVLSLYSWYLPPTFMYWAHKKKESHLFFIWATSRENLSLWFMTMLDSNQSAQLKELVRVMKLQI